MHATFLNVDDLARRNAPLQHLDARVKLVVTFVYLILLSSFSSHQVIQMMPLVIYPAVLFGLSSVPVTWFVRRFALVTPFIALFALGMLILDGGAGNTLQLIILVGIKSFLAVSVVTLLVASTGFSTVCASLRSFGVPAVLSTLLLLTMRYFCVVLDESARMNRAHALRCFGRNRLGLSSAVQLIALLFTRTLQRAERLYYAMQARGFHGDVVQRITGSVGIGSWVYSVIWISFFVYVRCCNLTAWLGSVFTGGIR